MDMKNDKNREQVRVQAELTAHRNNIIQLIQNSEPDMAAMYYAAFDEIDNILDMLDVCDSLLHSALKSNQDVRNRAKQAMCNLEEMYIDPNFRIPRSQKDHTALPDE